MGGKGFTLDSDFAGLTVNGSPGFGGSSGPADDSLADGANGNRISIVESVEGGETVDFDGADSGFVSADVCGVGFEIGSDGVPTGNFKFAFEPDKEVLATGFASGGTTVDFGFGGR